jgi:membrane protease YdiL (CAAX protease family)
VGTTLFGLGVYAVEMITQLATFMAHIFTLGILFGYLRHRTGSTWLTVILHGAHNAVSIAQVALLFGFA